MAGKVIAPAWSMGHRKVAWLSFLLFFVGFVLFFVSYVGNDWYVTPPSRHVYPPESINIPLSLGLFWMCVYGHCKYDLRVDYMVVGYIPFKSIQDAYQNFRTPCMVIITIAAIANLLALTFNLLFLSKFSISRFLGFIAGALEILTAVIALVGIIIFGHKFRGETESLPYGWSYWLMLAAIIILLADGIITIIISTTLNVQMEKDKMSATRKPLMYTVKT
jgi:hypothetical protein